MGQGEASSPGKALLPGEHQPRPCRLHFTMRSFPQRVGITTVSPSQQGLHVLPSQPSGAPVVDKEHPKAKARKEPHHCLVLSCHHRIGPAVGPHCPKVLLMQRFN